MIGFFNCERQFVNYFDEYQIIDVEGDDFPKIDGLVIDWVLSDRKNPTIDFARQASVVEKYIKKKVPTVIFDRFSSITFKEYKWLKKFNVKFFEPLLLHRDGFKYQPFWIYDIYDLDDFDGVERQYDVAFKGYIKDKIKSFEDYYVEVAINYPKFSVVYDSYLIKNKIEEYREKNVKKVTNLDLENVKFSIVIGSSRDYKVGKLDSLFANSVNNGCVPLIPRENRFYCSFQNVIEQISKPLDITQFFLDFTNDIRYGILMGIHEDVEKSYPEMKVNHFVDVIKDIIGGRNES